MPSKRRETVSSSQDNSPTDAVGQIQQSIVETARTLDVLNNSLTYANPIILYGSKTPSVSKRSSISSWHAKPSSKTNAADGMSAIPAVCNCACVIVRVKTRNKIENYI